MPKKVSIPKVSGYYMEIGCFVYQQVRRDLHLHLIRLLLSYVNRLFLLELVKIQFV